MHDRPFPNVEDTLEARGRLLALVQVGGLGLQGRLPPERELCERWGISRRSLRRALDALEAEGLIWRHRGKGTFVGQAPDPTGALAAEIVGETTALEVMEARLCLEPVLAARRARPEDVARMRALAGRVITAVDAESTELWDSALHRLIARVAGNRPLMTAHAMLDEIRASADWVGLRSRARSAARLKVSDDQHHAIIDAIEAGDTVAASSAMQAHLATLARNLEHLPGAEKETGADAQTGEDL